MLSHKGGTGRTVTTANVAYRLALTGRDVCCVDLDLTSATFGAVLDLPDLDAGAEEGVEHFLPLRNGEVRLRVSESTEKPVVKNVWLNQDSNVRQKGDVRFDLLPGNREHATLHENLDLVGEKLGDLLRHLAGTYDCVLVDVRSGESNAAGALLRARLPDLRWVVFHRQTRQHLAATVDLVSKLQKSGADDIVLVPTAVIDPSQLAVRNKAWFIENHAVIRGRFRDQLRGVERLEAVPMEPLLQLREGLVTNDDRETGRAHPETVRAFEQLAKSF